MTEYEQMRMLAKQVAWRVASLNGGAAAAASIHDDGWGWEAQAVQLIQEGIYRPAPKLRCLAQTSAAVAA